MRGRRPSRLEGSTRPRRRRRLEKRRLNVCLAMQALKKEKEADEIKAQQTAERLAKEAQRGEDKRPKELIPATAEQRRGMKVQTEGVEHDMLVAAKHRKLVMYRSDFVRKKTPGRFW